MPIQSTTSLQYAEYTLQVLGLCLLFGFIFQIRLAGSWRDTIRLPAPPPNDLQPMDILVAAYAFFLLPRMLMLVVPGNWSAATTQAVTSRPAAMQITDAPSIIALCLGECVAIVVFCILGYLRFRRSLSAWGLRFRHIGRELLYALSIYISAWPICSIILHLTILLLSFIPGYVFEEHGTIEMLRSGTGGTIVTAIVIFSAIVIAPTMEELFFRGLLQPAIARATGSQKSAIIIVGMTFGLIHYTVPQTVPALMIFGMILGYFYARTNSLTLVVLTHAIFNAKTILWLMINSKG